MAHTIYQERFFPATLWANQSSFGGGSITTAITLAATDYVDPDTFENVVATPGAVDLSPTIETDGDAFFVPVVGVGGVTLIPAELINQTAYGNAILTEPGTSQLRVYVAGQWRDAVLKEWNGSQWVERRVRAWNGSNWI